MTFKYEDAKLSGSDERAARTYRFQAFKLVPCCSLGLIALAICLAIPAALHVARSYGLSDGQVSVDNPMRLVLLREAAHTGAGEKVQYG